MEKVVIVIITVLGLLVIYNRFKGFKKGEPTSDELSRMILQKASSLSFYMSLYFWLVISYISESLHYETEQLIGYGIIGMAIIFVIIWSIINFLGVNKI